MDEKELLLKQIEQMITDSTKDSVKKTDIDAQVKDINGKIEKMNLDSEGLKSLKASVDQLVADVNKTASQVKEMKDSGVKTIDTTPKNFRDVMEAAIMEKKDNVLTEVTDTYGKRLSLKEFFEKNGSRASTPEFTLKAAVDMLQSEIVQNYVSTIRLTELDPSRVGIPLAIYPNVINVLPKKRIMKPNMAMLVVYSYWDGSGTKPEGTASGKSSFLFKTVSFPAFTIATYFTLSDETLDDIQEALDEIYLVAPDAINAKIDSKILRAAGDDSTDIKGLFSAAKSTGFVPGTYANFSHAATILDLIACMKLSAEASKYVPDTVWIDPLGVAKIAALKNAMDDSVNDRRIVFGAFGQPVAILGMAIKVNTAMAADSLAVSQNKQLLLGIRKDMTMEIGYNGTDFIEGQKTVVIKTRVAFGVRDPLATIYTSTVTADIAAITAV